VELRVRAADAPARPYHHGDLRRALLDSAERILDRDGLAGLTLRGAAREAGASHAAPKNHFGDLSGLFSELAIVGFARFTACLQAAADGETEPKRRLAATGRAYVAFASAHPGLFHLMFRSERLDDARPGLSEAMQAAAGVLAAAVGAARGVATGEEPSLPAAARMVEAWSLVHGFAMLLLDQRLAPILGRLGLPGDGMALLEEMLKGR
jgi:AcrR family transcriptional regulator